MSLARITPSLGPSTDWQATSRPDTDFVSREGGAALQRGVEPTIDGYTQSEVGSAAAATVDEFLRYEATVTKDAERGVSRAFRESVRLGVEGATSERGQRAIEAQAQMAVMSDYSFGGNQAPGASAWTHNDRIHAEAMFRVTSGHLIDNSAMQK